MEVKNENFSLTVLICAHSTNKDYDNLLVRSLESLENQTYKNFKSLIVLDDCWSETKETISKFVDTLNLKIVEKKERSGLSFAKNLGLSFIDTEYVCFLDADDLYCEEKLERQVKYMTENKSVDFLGTQTWVIYNNNEEKKDESCFNIGQYETHEEILNRITDENVLTHGSMMIRKKCIDELGGYQNVKGMEDWDLWKRAFEKGFKFYQIQERLYVYRIGSSTVR